MEIRAGEGLGKALVTFLPEDTMVPVYVLFNKDGEPTKVWTRDELPEKWLNAETMAIPMQLPISEWRLEALRAMTARRVVTYGPLR